jgi:hypothetical protein
MAQRDQISQLLRQQISDAYGAVLGKETTQGFQALTLERALDARLQQIEGTSLDGRPSERQRVENIAQDLLSAVEQIRGLPDSYFAPPDPDDAANTAITDEGDA